MNTLISLLAAIATPVGLSSGNDDLESDRVQLLSGKELSGHAVYEDRKLVLLRKGSKVREITHDKIESVTSRARGIRTLMKALDGYDAWRVSDNEALARQAEELGLQDEAHNLWWRVLAVEPENVTAHEALGHKRSGKRWKVVHAGRKVRMDSVRELARDFGKAWEFSTSHFDLRTNLSLEQALDLTLDLERLYVEFYRLFAHELRLFETEERMQVYIHSDASSFPEQSGESGYFKGDLNRVTIDASKGLVMYLVVHEVTHQLIYNTAVEEHTRHGAIPGWVDEGLAEYMAGSYQGIPARLVIDTESLRHSWFRVQADAKKPLSLSRVLNLSGGDFAASSHRQLKYAQVYTLVCFCLQGQEGRYRKAFMLFLNGAYDGKGSSTDFKSALAVKKKRFEEQWRGYVLQIAG